MVVLALVLFFFIVNISSAIMISKEMYAAHIVQARVVINGLMFTFSSLVLSGCIWKIWRMTSANVLLEARVSTVRSRNFALPEFVQICKM